MKRRKFIMQLGGAAVSPRRYSSSRSLPHIIITCNGDKISRFGLLPIKRRMVPC
jgi:hypothetical protein